MSLSRGLTLFKRVNTTFRKPLVNQMVQPVRHSGDLYSYRRNGYPPAKWKVLGADIMMAYMWWWILWHFWTEPDHFFGEYPYPDASKWTNEELGIPSDDSD